MAILTSYDLRGKKDSFASWISNLSPTDTYFVSVTKKEQVQNTLFQWQTDSLAAAS
ncbi:MAG: SU10 major capsid protein, partial [Bacteroidales bacterium]